MMRRVLACAAWLALAWALPQPVEAQLAARMAKRAAARVDPARAASAQAARRAAIERERKDATVEQRVRVVDVSGDVAYLEPGAAEGLRLSQRVSFGSEDFWIVALNDQHAAVALEGRVLAVRREGVARVPVAAPTARGPLRASRTPDAYRGQWKEPVLPALAQPVVRVPLSPFAAIGRESARTDVELSARTTGIFPLSVGDRVVGQSELRGRVRVQSEHEVPLSMLADASWLAPWANSSASAPRPNARVRQLELRYGAERSLLVRAGRLPSPAPMLGELDGARARSAYYGPFALGAFGGLLPDPIDGRLDDSSTRFGIDLELDAPDANARPYASVVAHGSTFREELDERKLDLLLGVRPGDVQLHAGGQLSLYADDPEGSSGATALRNAELASDPLELSLAHLDASWHGERAVLGVRGSTYVPERSQRLRALLDASSVCTIDPQLGSDCASVLPRRYMVGANLAFELGHALWLDSDATYATQSDQRLDHVSGRLGLRLLDPVRPTGALRASSLELSASGTHDVYYDHAGMRLAFDARWAPAFDLTLAYEPGLARYLSDDGLRILHVAQVDFAWVLSSRLRWIWSTEAQLGDDMNAIYLGTQLRAGL